MQTVLVWVLVLASPVDGGVSVSTSGDYASAQECERVKEAARSVAELGVIYPETKGWKATTRAAIGQCVQVQKVVPK